MSDDLIKRLRSGEHWPKTAADRIEELEREVERLRSLVPRPDQTQDELVWRDHLRGVPLAKLAKDAGVTKERIRQRINKIHVRRHDTAINVLRSIEANTCCENCKGAAFVARTVLARLEGKE